MLEHLEAGDHVEFFGPLVGEFLRRGLQVIHRDPGLNLVQAGDCQRPLGHVDSGNGCSGVGHGFGEDATPTADIHNAPAGELGALSNPVETQGIDLVQRAEIALRIPPARCQRIELGDLGLVDVAAKGR